MSVCAGAWPSHSLSLSLSLSPAQYNVHGAGNDIRESNVPEVRVQYRQEVLAEELRRIRQVAGEGRQ